MKFSLSNLPKGSVLYRRWHTFSRTKNGIRRVFREHAMVYLGPKDDGYAVSSGGRVLTVDARELQGFHLQSLKEEHKNTDMKVQRDKNRRLERKFHLHYKHASLTGASIDSTLTP